MRNIRGMGQLVPQFVSAPTASTEDFRLTQNHDMFS